MRYYVISDVHGFYDLMIESLEEKGYFNDPKPHKLIIIGDFLDRGPQAKQMEEFLVKGFLKDEIILVGGNHEDLIEELVDNIEFYSRNLKESHHFRNSTVDSVCQLTDLNIIDFSINKKEVQRRYYNTKFHRIIIPNCIDYFETKNYIFTHGYIPVFTDKYGNKLEDTFKYNPNWRNASKLEWYYAKWYNGMRVWHEGVREIDKTIVVGHWHSSFGHSKYNNDGSEFEKDANFSPFIDKGIIAIDGCVPRSFHINCLVIEDEPLIKHVDKYIVDKCAKALLNNELIILPTETVYGIAGIKNDIALKRIYEVKNRPLEKALPICVNSFNQIKKIAKINAKQEKIIKKLLPGPISVVLKSKENLGTILIRYSYNNLINKIIRKVKQPLYLTSANISGEQTILSINDAQNIFNDKISVYVDGILSKDNIPSTIIDLTKDQIEVLREGKVSLQELDALLKEI